MLDKLNAATVVVIIGVGLLLVSLLADVLGIGDDISLIRKDQIRGTEVIRKHIL